MANDISTRMASGPPPAEGVRSPREVQQALRDENGPKAAQAMSEERPEKPLEEVVSALNDLVQNLHKNLQFSNEEETGETIIKVVDSETNEVVRQIPSEEIVRLRRRMKEAAGVLFQGAV